MIQPNELRIGNWVLFKRNAHDAHEFKKVFTINPDGVSLDGGKGNPCDKHLIYPIPLTEERLLKAGFTPHSTGGRLIKNNIIIDLNLRTALLNYTNTTQTLCLCDNLHHIQNLYFALTGKELEINL